MNRASLGFTRATEACRGHIATAYSAMIVCMLILIYTGEKPNRAMYQMVWYELIGTRRSMLRR